MSQSTFASELEQNRLAYEYLRDQIRREHAGKFVAIALGKIVAVTTTFHEAQTAVARITPAAKHFAIFDASTEPVWESYDSISSEYT
jgi:hypothetical protein